MIFFKKGLINHENFAIRGAVLVLYCAVVDGDERAYLGPARRGGEVVVEVTVVLCLENEWKEQKSGCRSQEAQPKGVFHWKEI